LIIIISYFFVPDDDWKIFKKIKKEEKAQSRTEAKTIEEYKK